MWRRASSGSSTCPAHTFGEQRIAMQRGLRVLRRSAKVATNSSFHNQMKCVFFCKMQLTASSHALNLAARAGRKRKSKATAVARAQAG